MKKELPKVFVNKIEKELKNNEKIHVSDHEKNLIEQKNKNQKPDNSKNNKNQTEYKIINTINKKINEIMNNKKYIYKIPVRITTEEKEITTKIIGKNKTNIITIDNELIKIKDIKNIEIYEK